jgi:glutamine synthetase
VAAAASTAPARPERGLTTRLATRFTSRAGEAMVAATRPRLPRMPAPLSFDDLERAVAAGGIDTVLVCMVDMQGRLMGKRFHAEFFVETARGETHACDYLLADDIEMEPVPGYAAASWQRGYGDFALKPDLDTLRRVPWLEATALVLCDVLDARGEREIPHSPRAMLKRQLARLAERGWTAMFASELEFYLFDESYESARAKRYHDLQTAGQYIEDYHILQTTREEPVMRAIRNGLHAAGIPVENSKGEWGPGQEEINVRYADALSMADRHSILKNACKEIAAQSGRAISFMAKWRDDLAGSSAHIHQSLQDRDGKPLFLDAGAEYGMSALMRAWVAGQLAHAREITWFLAPYVNSYKRFQAASFAPTRAVWSRDNRTAGFRLCAEGSAAIRIECRIGGADLNPYLAYSALIAAGLAGIDGDLELAPPFAGDAYGDDGGAPIPTNLRDAAAAMAGSAMLREAFGAEVLAHYHHTACWELAEHERRVTDIERMRGFERY